MSDYSDFKKCLKIGQIIEKKAQLKIIEFYINKCHVEHENDTYEYDFKSSNEKTYEVKYCSLSLYLMVTIRYSLKLWHLISLLESTKQKQIFAYLLLIVKMNYYLLT